MPSRSIEIVAALALAACGGRTEHPVTAGPPTTTTPRGFTRGLVVNHWVGGLAQPSEYGAAWFDGEDVAWIAHHGFDHIRLRVDARNWLRPDGTLDPDQLAPIDSALGWARAEHIGLVLAVTRFPGDRLPDRAADLDDPPIQASAPAMWGRVAERYRAIGDELRFELVHHTTPGDPAALRQLASHALAAIRAVDRERYVYVAPPGMRFDRMDEVALFDDPRTGIAITFDEPAAFAWQFAPDRPRLAFPGDGPLMTATAIDAAIGGLARWRAAHAPGHDLYVAQFGVYYAADEASQERYLAALHRALVRHGLGWAIYDYHTGAAMRAPDGTSTVAYRALGLAPVERREISLAFVEREVTFAAAGAPDLPKLGEGEARKVSDAATFVVEGNQLGLHTTIDDKRKRTTAIQLGADGLPDRYESVSYTTTDRWDTTVDESYRRAPGAHAFYLPREDNPLAVAVIARWFADHRGATLELEPNGAATAELAPPVDFHGEPITRVTIDGLDVDPQTVWLDGNGNPFAVIGDDVSGYIVTRHVEHYAELEARQVAAEAERGRALAARLLQRHAGGLVIRHARVFDSETPSVTPGRSIVIRDGKIQQVAADDQIAAPAGADELDARGRFVMPGLWDSHAHLFGRRRALLQLAAGVTTTRDMGNEGDLPALVARFDRGDEIGPRTLLVMRLGATWSPSVPQPKTAEEARALVRAAAARGYVQIKVLDDIPKALVPVLAAAAHEHGMRFSGHLPSAMTVQEFVAAGAQELQHVGSLFRKLPKPRRFGAPTAAAIAAMASRHVAFDATLAQYSVADDGLNDGEAAFVARLPPLARRQAERGAVPATDRVTERTSYAAYREAVRAAFAAGLVVLPGTDGFMPGAALHRELAAYVALGVPTARVLQLATLSAARNMNRSDRSGSLAPGKDADLIVIDGDPLRDIHELARVDVVVRGGWTLAANELLAAARVRLQ